MKIYKDSKGHEYIKKSYFVNGKMKYEKVYVVDGMPVDEFYEKNATELDHFIDGNYELISSEMDRMNQYDNDIDTPEIEDLLW